MAVSHSNQVALSMYIFHLSSLCQVARIQVSHLKYPNIFCFPTWSYLVNVKWSGKKFDDIELNLDEPGLVFKAQLFALTGVEPDRQKIIAKGGMLKVWDRYCWCSCRYVFCILSQPC